MNTIDSVESYIEERASDVLQRLRDFVAIPSVSADAAFGPRCVEAAEWACDWLQSLGGDAQVHDPPEVGGVSPHPIVTARFETPGASQTVLFYGHYDVQPAAMEDGWTTDPWTVRGPDDEGYLYGRGVIDDKGQVCSVLAAIEAFVRTATPLPLNVVVLLEGMEESGSEGLAQFVEQSWPTLFRDVTSVLICDTEWLGTETPSVVHALRGLNYFQITVHGPQTDLHSGSLGGVAWEPLHDLIQLLAGLRDGPMGAIRIPGFDRDIMDVPPAVADVLRRAEVDVPAFLRENGLPGSAVGNDVTEIVRAKAFQPTLTVHGVGKVFAGPGAKTVIPGTAVAYMSTRLVPFQNCSELAQQTIDILHDRFAALHSPNTLDVELLSSGNWWYVDPSGPHISAALQALTEVFGTAAVPMAEGGSIPVAHLFQQRKLPVVLLSLGKAYGRAHGPDERHHVDCLHGGAKAVARYLQKIASVNAAA